MQKKSSSCSFQKARAIVDPLCVEAQVVEGEANSQPHRNHRVVDQTLCAQRDQIGGSGAQRSEEPGATNQVLKGVAAVRPAKRAVTQSIRVKPCTGRSAVQERPQEALPPEGPQQRERLQDHVLRDRGRPPFAESSAGTRGQGDAVL